MFMEARKSKSLEVIVEPPLNQIALNLLLELPDIHSPVANPCGCAWHVDSHVEAEIAEFTVIKNTKIDTKNISGILILFIQAP